MPSAMNVPIPPTAVTLSFGGVDFRLDASGDKAGISFPQLSSNEPNDLMKVHLTNFTGTLSVSMSSLVTAAPQVPPSLAAAPPRVSLGGVVEEEPASPLIKRSVNKISPRQQQLPFKSRPSKKTRVTKSEEEVKKTVRKETPGASSSSSTVPQKPTKGSSRALQKRTLLEIQTNPVPSPFKKTREDSLLLCQSELSQPSYTSSPEEEELTQGDTVSGEDENPNEVDFPLPPTQKSTLHNDEQSTTSSKRNDEPEEEEEPSSIMEIDVPVAPESPPPPAASRGDAPGPRWGHTLTKLDENRIIVYGGQSFDPTTGAPCVLSDVHIYDSAQRTWYKPVNCEGVPRQWHTATFLPERQLLISFGGETKNPKNGKMTTTDQVMVLDTEILLWYPPAVSGVVPTGRSGHSATLLQNTNELVVFGGVKGSKWQNSVAVLDIPRWKWSAPKVSGDAPRPRSYHSATALAGTNGSASSRVVVFGGNNGTTSFNTVHVLETDGTSWSWVNPSVSGCIPKVRTGHSATLLADQKTILVYGGWDPNMEEEDGGNDEDMIFDDSYYLDTETWTWRTGPKPSFAADESPAENGGGRRVGHTSVLVEGENNNSEVLVFGGRVPGDEFTGDFQKLMA